MRATEQRYKSEGGFAICSEIMRTPYANIDEVNPVVIGRMARNTSVGGTPVTAEPQGAANSQVANLVGTTYLASAMVDWLFNNTVFLPYATPSLNNTANLEWGGWSNGADISFPDDTAEAPAPATIRRDQQFFKRSLAPRRMAAFTPLTDLATIQSSQAHEMMTRMHLMEAMGQGMDMAAGNVILDGTTPAIPEQAGTAGTNGDTVDHAWTTRMYTKATAANALLGTTRWVLPPELYGKLMRTPVVSGTTAEFILDRTTSRILNFPVLMSNSVRHNYEKGSSGKTLSGAVFGDLSQVLFAEWGTPRLVVDESTRVVDGFITVGIARYINFGIRQEKALVKATNILTT